MGVSGAQTVASLMQNPRTSAVIMRHLGKMVTAQRLQNIHATFVELRDRNMGGGIPFEVINAIIKDLDQLDD